MINKNLVIIGAGPAGLAAAIAAYDNGERDILVLERDCNLGGILNQCIHNGFGLHTFKEELTGPEYAERYILQAQERKIEIQLNTMVLDINKDKTVTCISVEKGLQKINAKAIILSCGCRERPRGAINIAGARSAGIYSAGMAQKLVNLDGYMVGKKVVILGSGDIGLIMARRMTFEGAEVKCVVELMPYSSGLNRNIAQCLKDFDIPLLLSHTIVQIKGDKRVSSVVIAEVDEKLNPIMSTAQEIECDCILLSVGLLPENELAKMADIELSRITGGAVVNQDMMTNIEGIFACGNVLHVHDLVDFVSEESAHAGICAVNYINGKLLNQNYVDVQGQKGVRYVVPQKISRDALSSPITLKMRVGEVQRNTNLVCEVDGVKLVSKKKPIVTPGEMITLELSVEQLKSLSNAKTMVLSLQK